MVTTTTIVIAKRNQWVRNGFFNVFIEIIPYRCGCVCAPIGVCGTFEEENVVTQVVFTRDTVEGYK